MQNSIIVSDNDTKNLTVLSRQNVLDKDFTVYGSVENPLFLAKDVAEWIDYSKTSEGFYNVSKMLMGIDDDEKTTITIRNSDGKTHNQSFVTENGLYEILMLSRKPIAKQFKKEVKKILHQIRTTGGYTVPRTFADALRLAAEQQERIALMQPKADVYDEIVDRNKCINFRDMAVKLGFSQSEFMTILKSKYIYKNTIGEYRAYSGYRDLFSLRTYVKSIDQTGEQLMLNMNGITYFCNKYGKNAIADSFISDGENEYKKIIDETSEKIETYSFKQICEIAKITNVTLTRFLLGIHMIKEDYEPSYMSLETKEMNPDGTFTEKGKNRILKAFSINK